MELAEIHISSMVVHAQPETLEITKSYIAGLPGAEIHGESKTGKLVVVLESNSETRITDVMDQISNFDQVLNTALVYHHILPENFEELELS